MPSDSEGVGRDDPGGRYSNRFGTVRGSSHRQEAAISVDAPLRLAPIAPYLGSGLALLLFGGALYLLHRQVAAYHAEDVRRALAALSWERIGAALGLTGSSYFLLMLYDLLALRHLRKTLPFGRVALASFTSYAFTHSFGFGSILHATIRYRLYAPLGLRTVDIAEITAFVNITLMIGLAIMFPVIALVDASALEGMGLPRSTSLAFGAGALGLAAAYTAIGWRVERLEVLGFALKVPSPIITIAQIGLSLTDLALAGAILFVCLPYPGAAGYLHVLAVFAVALTAGIISHVPGGVGVFDTIVLVGLSDQLPGDQVLAALLVFRIIYFLVPLIIAGTLFGGLEAISGPASCCTRFARHCRMGRSGHADRARRLQLHRRRRTPVLQRDARDRSAAPARVRGLAIADYRGLAFHRQRHRRAVVAVVLPASEPFPRGLVSDCSAVPPGRHGGAAQRIGVGAGYAPVGVFLPSPGGAGRVLPSSALVAEPFTPARFVAVGVVLGSALWLGLFSYKQVR